MIAQIKVQAVEIVSRKTCFEGGANWIFWKIDYEVWETGVKYDILAQGAMTKYHRLGGLNSRHLFITILDPRKSQVKVLVRSFFWFADSCLPSCPHLVEGERALGSSSSFEDTNRIVGPHPPDLIATHCPSQTSPPNSVISLGVRVSMHEFWGGTHMHMSRH